MSVNYEQADIADGKEISPQALIEGFFSFSLNERPERGQTWSTKFHENF